MSGKFSDGYCKTSCTEIETLEKMGAWGVIDRTDDMNTIDSTWYFKLKRLPDSLKEIWEFFFVLVGINSCKVLFIWKLCPSCEMDYHSFNTDFRIFIGIEIKTRQFYGWVSTWWCGIVFKKIEIPRGFWK